MIRHGKDAIMVLARSILTLDTVGSPPTAPGATVPVTKLTGCTKLHGSAYRSAPAHNGSAQKKTSMSDRGGACVKL